VEIRDLTEADWPAVAAVYAAGIATGNATFEAEPPTWAAFDAAKRPDLRLVATEGDHVLGATWAGAYSPRPVYAGVVEHSVFVDPTLSGRGTGRALLEALLARCAEVGVWTVQSGIFPENAGSLALHERLGFRVVGTRERLGYMTHGPWAGQWRDVVLVERRAQNP
jgi:L-amino acid N-acyltransferase YncA